MDFYSQKFRNFVFCYGIRQCEKKNDAEKLYTNNIYNEDREMTGEPIVNSDPL